MIISKSAVKEYLSRDLDSFLWMKRLNKDQVLRELVEVAVLPQFKTDPWLHQLVCFFIAIHYPNFLFLLDMGLGKTKIMLDVLTQLQREKRLKRALVFVPRKSTIDSWIDAAPVHSDLEPCPVKTSTIEEKWEMLSNPTGDFTIIDYQGFQLATTKPRKKKSDDEKTKYVRHESKIKKLEAIYNVCILDESHLLSSRDNLWFSMLRQFTGGMDVRYALTGTLFSKDPVDAWSQFYLVDRGETLGETLGMFRAAFYEPDPMSWGKFGLMRRQGSSRIIHRMLQHRSIRYDANEVQDLPPIVRRTKYASMTSEQQGHFLRALDALIQSGSEQVKDGAAWLRMRQITSGHMHWEDEYGKHEIIFKENPKMDLLEGILESIGDKKIVICYDYTPTGRMICKRLTELHIDHEWFYGGTKDKTASKQRFLKDPTCQAFVMNSGAGGTGTDGLQAAAHYMVFYESPSSPTVRKQTEKRLPRPGQKFRTFIYDLVLRKTLDEKILTSIAEGIDLHDQVVGGKLKPEFLLSL